MEKSGKEDLTYKYKFDMKILFCREMKFFRGFGVFGE